jgi:hypothetical protein
MIWDPKEFFMARTLNTSLSLLALGGLISCSSPEEEQVTDVSKIVYAVRQHTVLDDSGRPTTIDVAGGMGQVMDYGRYVPGGRLEVLDLRTGEVTNIIAGYEEADISSLDVSFDATKVLFTMKARGDDNYHIYWASLEPEDGRYEIHQLTFGKYDDINAVWAPGERIVFVTNQGYTQMGTRADEYNHSRVVTQLATITFGGGDADRKLCSQNLSHLVTLFSMQDGRVGFSRWEHLENVNDVKVFAMNPDCTQMTAISGQHGKPGNSVVQVTESNVRNVFYGIVTERENTIQAGAIVKIDARFKDDPNRVDEEKDDSYSIVTPNVPTDDSASFVGRYRSPAVLPDGRLMVSWAKGSVNESNEFSLTPPDYGIYVYNTQTRKNELIFNHESTWEVYARPIAKRDEPPIISGRQVMADAAIPTTLGSIDVKQTSLYSAHGETVSGAQFDDTNMDVALEQATRVRIIEGFSSEGAPGVTMFGLTMAEGAALIGEATVNSDGSWMAHVPPYVPIHLQPIDRFDLSIRNQTTWIQGMPNEARICGGCHESRTARIDPTDQQLTIAAGKDPEAMNTAIADRVEYPWAYATNTANPNQIQSLLNARCVACHNETMNGDGPQETYTVSMTDPTSGMATGTEYIVPRMDLSERPITVNYDREEQEWPASYVSLFYPAALEMGEVMNFMVTGDVPPLWAVPSDARNSKLIEKLNITALGDSAEYAWPLGEAFTDATIQGGTRTDHALEHGMTRDEVVMLIRAIDMGGQFYSRQNTDFVPFNNDPIAGTQY